jgi:hypothetical protein
MTTVQDTTVIGAPIVDDRLRSIEQYLYDDAGLLDSWRLHECHGHEFGRVPDAHVVAPLEPAHDRRDVIGRAA